ncbi:MULTISPECIES: tRNA pseudouridine(55) synthase TruB [Carnobacterium]|uniref:tRNA pseudouridine(55) synthase TruB n=1 Tax=Carnobacterium TaxID=2747 RepID=UPI00288F4369|nr:MULTISPECIES: tRNA pseudouridine(55) synthase TruB [Carnobacterium]MDT1938734.1 tRNA pseudouridine(55) synthase TruB [Carnobacterium divergens]MDT1941172.1 tRNA pseudouridine(55) synthase TruB [Carnobacterium divergens]MDT1946970.1 tRNA pseudouridine(55) synthase TruB [Carnobacterium divergens]MDT1949407.1 tRNA pseudouridine(55) synthase TruB [Carnobacterium divergens]MDT1954585.1 tRNA pseudouridine(55) synthase TruB [Carnobacterium divergens]
MDGILPLWKERGMTSHDCVFKLRKILNTKKIGHTGTLDPDVDGVLPICVGKATKVVEYMMETGKTYVGEITLGYSTTTEDASGERVEVKKVTKAPTIEEIDHQMKNMEGTIIQVPPMFSAVKVNGKRLYEYARNGETVERPKRKAEINSFIRTSEPIFNEDAGTVKWRFEVACGKGTYVRTLAVDLGEALGYPAHMSDLTRILSGTFKASDCLTLEQVAEAMKAESIQKKLFPLEFGLKEFETMEVSDELWQKVKNGVPLPKSLFNTYSRFPVVMMYQGQATSLYDVHPTKPQLVKPTKVLRNQ